LDALARVGRPEEAETGSPTGRRLARECVYGQKPNNLPAVAFQDIPELPVENFPVGRRHLQAESVVAVAQQLATNFESRTGYETYQ